MNQKLKRRNFSPLKKDLKNYLNSMNNQLKGKMYKEKS